MKKTILTMVLFSVINSSHSMMIAEGVELLSSQSWTTGNIMNGHMEETRSSQFSNTSEASAIAIGGSGVVNTNVISSGIHDYRVFNFSSTVGQYYTITIKLCADNDNCFINVSRYGVSPMHGYKNHVTTYITSLSTTPICTAIAAVTSTMGEVFHDAANGSGNSTVCITG